MSEIENQEQRFSLFTFTEEMAQQRTEYLLTIVNPSVRDWIEMYTVEAALQKNDLWEKLFASEAKSKKAALKKAIYTNYSPLSVSSMLEYFAELKDDRNAYFKEFWQMLVLRGDLEKLLEQDFNDLLSSNVVPISWVLEESNLIYKFNKQIKDILLKDSRNFEYVFRYQTEPKVYHYTFPKSISKNEWYELATRYIQTPIIIGGRTASPNLNIVRLMKQSTKMDNKYFTVDAQLELVAQQEVARQEKEMFGIDQENNSVSSFNGTTFQYGVTTSKQDLNNEISNEHLYVYVDRELIMSQKTPLEIYFYVRDRIQMFLTPDRRLELQEFDNTDSSTLMRLIEKHLDSQYGTSMWFSIKNNLVIMQFWTIFNILKERGVSPYDVIESFFTKFIKEEFDLDWLKMQLPNDDEPLQHQNMILFSLQEGIMKRWELYVQHGEIDSNLYRLKEQMSSYETVPSLIQDKYAILTEDGINISNVFFSDQSPLAYYDASFDDYTFFDNLAHHPGEIKVDWKYKYQNQAINNLLSMDLISERNGNIITKRYQASEIQTLMSLWQKNALNIYNLSEEYIDAVNRLQGKGLIKRVSGLFDPGEAKYLNFILNKKDLSDSMDLRNKYVHDYFPKNESELIQDNNYALMITFFFMIKIEEELATQRALDTSTMHED